MNINDAKNFIKQTVSLYLEKDETGDYVIPVSRQRPVFLLGAPGVGKTAIMEQITAELGIALVSYSMTHHTRQSAIGLPMIRRELFDGVEKEVTEYTMSEIIVSIYETMKQSGISEGILFLDEINCVSETLAPSMLQFLQYKVFGRDSVPSGWIIVTAGNPPEFNKSVREFDVAVMDRLKVIKVEPDFLTFKQYAIKKAIHPTIINFLDINRDYFYKIENTPDGRTYVTARGWEDLSEMLLLYEKKEYVVDERLIGQYLNNEVIVSEFAAYYELYNKYNEDSFINEVLLGHASEEFRLRAAQAQSEEKLSILSMLANKVIHDMKTCMIKTDYLAKTSTLLKTVKDPEPERVTTFLDNKVMTIEREIEAKKKAMALTSDEESMQRHVILVINQLKDTYISSRRYNYSIVKETFGELLGELRQSAELTKEKLANLFEFTQSAFGEGEEMETLVSRLSVNPYSSGFVARFGSNGYERYAGAIAGAQPGGMSAEVARLFDEKKDTLKAEIAAEKYLIDDII